MIKKNIFYINNGNTRKKNIGNYIMNPQSTLNQESGNYETGKYEEIE